MIVKKIQNPKKSSSKSSRINGLLDYIKNPERVDGTEKCVHAGAVNFLAEKHKAQKQEMLSLSIASPKVKDTISHYVLSFREEETPTKEQTDQAVKTFLKEMKWKEHQAIYALHQDTDNSHIHIAVNRVHPETLRCITPNKGFDIKQAHKAIAVIEKEQGWSKEKGALYEVKNQKILPKEKEREVLAKKSPQAIASRATSWQELHTNLRLNGMRYYQFGSGARMVVKQEDVKASSVDRSLSFAKLQKRLGPYEPPTTERYYVALDRERMLAFYQQKEQKLKEIEKRIFQLKEKHTLEKMELKQKQKEERELLLKGDWKGKRPLLNEKRAQIAKEQKKERDVLQNGHKTEKTEIVQEKKELRSKKYDPEILRNYEREEERDGGRGR